MIGSMTRTQPIDDAPRRETAVSSPATKAWSAPRPRLLALVLVLVTLVAYQPTWRAGFISDDDTHLTANPALTARHGLKMIWTKLAVGRYYPLTQTTFWVQRRLWGLHPMPYHLVNVLLHAANAVVLYFLLRQLRIPAAWLAAMVWALHPVNVESVAWIAELKNTQSGLFFFLSLLFFLRFAEQKQRIIRWYSEYVAGFWYVAAFGCGVAAILSNATTAVLPLALLLAVRWQRGYLERADAVRLAAVLRNGLGGLGIDDSRAIQSGPESRRGPMAVDVCRAVGDRRERHLVLCGQGPVALPPGVRVSTLGRSRVVRVVVGADRRARGAHRGVMATRGRAWCRAVLFVGGYFVAALLPVLGFFNIFFFRYSFVADHFQYLASVGIITLVCARRRDPLEARRLVRRLVRRSFSEGGSISEGGLAKAGWRRRTCPPWRLRRRRGGRLLADHTGNSDVESGPPVPESGNHLARHHLEKSPVLAGAQQPGNCLRAAGEDQ